MSHGGSFGLSPKLHPQAPAPCSIYRERHREVCSTRTVAFLGVRGRYFDRFSGHVVDSIRVVDHIVVTISANEKTIANRISVW